MDVSEGADDQGAGWLLVKKKHRSSSKVSVHNWVGGLSTKQKSSSSRSQPSPGVKLGCSNCNVQSSKAGRDNLVFDPGVSVEESNLTAGSSQLPQKVNVQPHINNTNVPPKIKWGDLDDRTLLLHQGKSSGGDVKFGEIDSPHLVYRKSEDGNDFPYPPTDQKVSNIVGMSVVQDHPFQASHSLLANEKFSEDDEMQITDVKVFDPNGLNCNGHLIHKEPRGFDPSVQSNESFSSAVADVFLTAAVKHETDPLQVSEFSIDVNLKTVGFPPDASTLHPDKGAPGATVVHSPSREELSCAASEQGATFQASASGEGICSEVSEHVIGRDSSMMAIPQDCEIEEPNKTEPEVVAVSTISASKEDYKCQQDDVVLDNLTKTQITDHVNAHEDESKERFRERLWCFLFENLNRAIDELYLLCELECDLEQMKEGILVLEEAASDFRELNARVEEFEKVKKSLSHVLEGAPLTMKSDHRRPHALSWEVRRMTTSPRRAEILSSSLEAFRKIQQDRANACAGDAKLMGPDYHSGHCGSSSVVDNSNGKRDNRESMPKPRKQHIVSDLRQGKEEKNVDSNRCGYSSSKLPPKECYAAAFTGKSKRDLLSATSDTEKQPPRREKVSTVIANEKGTRSLDNGKRQISFSDKEKEKRNGNLWKSMDAWKEKRNWEDILAPPHRVSSRFSHSPGMSRKSNERARTLHDKLMSPDKRKKSVVDLKKEAEEKHARAMRIRNELESERVQRLQRTSEKLNRVSEFQAERNMKLREVMHARHRRSELRHEAFLAQVVRRANDESSKVNEVRFITSLNEENKKLIWRQKIHDSELRMAEKRQLLKTKQKEDMAREEAVLERRRLLEAEKLQRIAEIQRKKEEAQVRREEERKASSAAREAKAMEQMRRKEVRAKAQQEEAELLAQKLAERLSESEQRRKFYLEQIRERASMDYRDQTSPFLRRSVNKEGQGRSTPPNSSIEDSQANNNASLGCADLPSSNMALQHSLKRRIKKIRQKLMALKHEYSEPSIGADVARIGYRTTIGTARAKIGRWLQELQKLRQARKEGATNFGLIAAEMIKFLEGRDAELHASRQAGLVDFIASALPASHTSKPEACQVTLYLLRLLKVVLTMPANRSYFLSQNLLPPVIPMLAAALENYIKIAASVNTPGLSNLASGKSSIENLDLISEILDGFLWIVAAILGHVCSDERQIQMQDGLLELVIAYQVIQHLRDLFALYDRPQVEGSPFPSSIILSIKLLTVMTSRFRNSSSIDWESFPAEITSVNGNEGVKVAEVEDMKGLPDVPKDRPLDKSSKTKGNAESLLQMKISDEVECTNPKRETADVKDENPSIPCNDVTKGFVSLKGDEKSSDKVQDQKEVRLGLKQPVPYLLSVVSETGLVCLPSMLTAVLLQANNRLSSEQISYVLPTNFDEVATGVLKVLNNLALIDIIFIQRMLARPDLKMEFFHLMGFLLSHCTSKWGVATDQVGLLLLESLSLLGYFALFHPENQAVLRWGKSPTILHKVCDLPFIFFSDPELMPVLAGTLIAACFGCDQNKSVILQELSMEMLLSLLKCCKNGFLPPPPAAAQSVSVVLDNHHHHPLPEETGESNQLVAESRTQKSHRFSSRNARTLSQKVAVSSNNTKSIKTRNLRENNKVSKVSEEMGHKQNQHIPETPSGLMLMLHNRFPQSFIHRAENFFSIDSCSFTEDDI